MLFWLLRHTGHTEKISSHAAELQPHGGRAGIRNGGVTSVRRWVTQPPLRSQKPTLSTEAPVSKGRILTQGLVLLAFLIGHLHENALTLLEN